MKRGASPCEGLGERSNFSCVFWLLANSRTIERHPSLTVAALIVASHRIARCHGCDIGRLTHRPPEEELNAIGTHCLTELYDCPATTLNDVAAIEALLAEAVRRMGADLVKRVSHQFSPHGVTVLGLLAESHISIHTWPECGYVAIDAFTCGTRCRPRLACEYLAKAFEAKRSVIVDLTRGAEGVSDVAEIAGAAQSSSRA